MINNHICILFPRNVFFKRVYCASAFSLCLYSRCQLKDTYVQVSNFSMKFIRVKRIRALAILLMASGVSVSVNLSSVCRLLETKECR